MTINTENYQKEREKPSTSSFIDKFYELNFEEFSREVAGLYRPGVECPLSDKYGGLLMTCLKKTNGQRLEILSRASMKSGIELEALERVFIQRGRHLEQSECYRASALLKQIGVVISDYKNS